MTTVGYLPFEPTEHSVEAAVLAEHAGVAVDVVHDVPALNGDHVELPARRAVAHIVDRLARRPHVVAEGPSGLLWAALLRSRGYRGGLTVLPYLNPRRWHDVAWAALFARSHDPCRDRVFLGSTASAALYVGLGVPAVVGEPYGVDDAMFHPGSAPATVRRELAIPPGRLLLFAGRAHADKDIYLLLRVGLMAQVLFPDLRLIIAAHAVDDGYLAAARRQLDPDAAVHIVRPSRRQLAELYRESALFLTVSTSHFETFGRAPAEALASGTPAVAPRFDGFAEVLDQPGGHVVGVELPPTGPPRVDEHAVLRAVYEVLSDPHPPPSDEIATIARRRFGRCRTMRLLGSLAGATTAAAGVSPRSTAVPIPDAWHQPLSEIHRRSPPDALDWYWRHDGHAELDGFADELRLAVRRALCRPPMPSEVTACR